MNSARRLAVSELGLRRRSAPRCCAVACCHAEGRDPLKIPGAQYEPTTFDEIDGWADDDHDAAFETFLKSCTAILKGTPVARPGQPMYGGAVRGLPQGRRRQAAQAGRGARFLRAEFPAGAHFAARRCRMASSPATTSRSSKAPRAGPRATTIRSIASPPNLLPGGRMRWRARRPAKARRSKHTASASSSPFYDRAAIEDGVLDGRNLEICWLKDPIDAFFAHIQGSVRVQLDDGKLMRLNYQAANGHPYYAVGRWLIERSIVPRTKCRWTASANGWSAIRRRARSCGGGTSPMCSSARPSCRPTRSRSARRASR